MASYSNCSSIVTPQQIESFLLKINQPEVFGPGYWRVMAVISLDANTYAKKMHFIHLVEVIFNSIPCQDPCRKDSLEYLQDVPITTYWSIYEHGEDRGMFYWVVDFHNWVNRKLGKPEVPREVAYQFYKNPEGFVCHDTGCSGQSSEEINLEEDAIGFRPF